MRHWRRSLEKTARTASPPAVTRYERNENALVGDSATITYDPATGKVSYTPGKANGACDPCFQELKKLMDRANGGVIIQRDPNKNLDHSTIDVSKEHGYKPGSLHQVSVDTDIPEIPEVDSTGKVVETNRPPFAAVLYHEIGHAVAGKEHVKIPANTRSGNAGTGYIDPTIAFENIGRACLRNSGVWPTLLDRVPWYYDE